MVSPLFIGITGGSSSGKSSIAKIMQDILIDCTYLSMDDYYKPLKDKSILANDRLFKTYLLSTNLDEPDSINITKFISDIKQIKQGNSIRKPIFDHVTTSISDYKTVKPNKYVIIDKKLIRKKDSKARLANPKKIQKKLGWRRKYNFNSLIIDMVENDLEVLKKRKN